MSTLDFTAKLVSDDKLYDVIVVGGGPAGLGAALSAAKMSAKTLLLEAAHNFGGVANKAMFMPFNRLYVDGDIRQGIISDFVEKIISMGDLVSVPGKTTFTDGGGLDIHPEYFQIAVFDLLTKYKCDYKLYSPVVGVTKKGSEISGVVAATKKGFKQFRGKIFIDATGDGDLAYYAGAEYMEGDEKSGIHMPTSIVYMLGNVDVDKATAFINENNKEFIEYILRARREGYQTNVWYAFDRTTIPHTVNVNNGGPYGCDNIDGTDADHLTRLTRLGLKAAVDFVAFARKYRICGLEDCYLLRTGAAAVRDTRRFIGEYVVSLEDAETGTEFIDAVSRKYGKVDANQIYIGTMKNGYGYPFRAMLPKGVDSLIMAGRCGSSTFLGHAAGKSMGNMMETGQAAGVAAALCAADSVQPRALDIRKLKARLHVWNENI